MADQIFHTPIIIPYSYLCVLFLYVDSSYKNSSQVSFGVLLPIPAYTILTMKTHAKSIFVAFISRCSEVAVWVGVEMIMNRKDLLIQRSMIAVWNNRCVEMRLWYTLAGRIGQH